MKKINLLCFAFLFSNVLLSQTVFINEIHYDNDGVDVGEAIEIAGPAGTNLSGWTLVLYNGATGAVYDTIILTNFFELKRFILKTLLSTTNQKHIYLLYAYYQLLHLPQ